MSTDPAREALAEPQPTHRTTGLAALCALARFHQVAADPQTLAHQLGFSSHQGPLQADVLQAARHLGLKARWVTVSAERLVHTPLPALAWLAGPDGSHAVVMAQTDGKQVLMQDFEPGPDTDGKTTAARSRPQVMSLQALQQIGWSGQLLLVTSRASVMGALARFDFSWFIPALVKYR